MVRTYIYFCLWRMAWWLKHRAGWEIR